MKGVLKAAGMDHLPRIFILFEVAFGNPFMSLLADFGTLLC
jgi:hypothetical protein